MNRKTEGTEGLIGKKSSVADMKIKNLRIRADFDIYIKKKELKSPRFIQEFINGMVVLLFGISLCSESRTNKFQISIII